MESFDMLQVCFVKSPFIVLYLHMFVFQKGEYMCYAHPLDGFDEKYLG